MALSPEPLSGRAARAAERRQAIIEAALDEFIARGFAATRLDDVAKRAGVAKGTIYLHFKDKESMFEELIRTAIVPLIGAACRAAAASRLGPRGAGAVCPRLHPGGRDHAARRHRAADRGGGAALSGDRRFLLPRGGVARARRRCAALIELGVARGEIRQPELARFPQIVVAPAMIAVIWKSLFERHAPLDAIDDAARPSRSDLWRTEGDMTSSRTTLLVLAGACAGGHARRLQRQAAIPASRAGSRPT